MKAIMERLWVIILGIISIKLMFSLDSFKISLLKIIDSSRVESNEFVFMQKHLTA